MFGPALIVFREVLEAALVIGIITAATQGVPNRARWIAGGLAAGLAGAGLVAATTDSIANLFSGVGQEVFNAVVLGIAVLMLAWHNVWMAAHGAELARDARSVGRQITDGSKECSVLFLIILLAVLREGSETVLFLYGMSAGEGGLASTLGGGALGLAAGVIVGWGLYAGLVRIPVRWFFGATSLLVLLLAAGMASQAARFLIQADVLPALGSPLWDTSSILPPDSAVGTLLHGLAGYDARPAGMQIAFYVVALLGIGAAMKFFKPRPSPSP